MQIYIFFSNYYFFFKEFFHNGKALVVRWHTFFLNFKHTVVLLLCHVTLPAENCVYRTCTQELR